MSLAAAAEGRRSRRAWGDLEPFLEHRSGSGDVEGWMGETNWSYDSCDSHSMVLLRL